MQEAVFSTSSGASGFSYSESIPVKPDKIREWHAQCEPHPLCNKCLFLSSKRFLMKLWMPAVIFYDIITIQILNQNFIKVFCVCLLNQLSWIYISSQLFEYGFEGKNGLRRIFWEVKLKMLGRNYDNCWLIGTVRITLVGKNPTQPPLASNSTNSIILKLV